MWKLRALFKPPVQRSRILLGFSFEEVEKEESKQNSKVKIYIKKTFETSIQRRRKN